MIVTQTDATVKKAYTPQKITIVLETEAEAVAFSHLIYCWSDQKSCIEREEVEDLARRIRQEVKLPQGGPSA